MRSASGDMVTSIDGRGSNWRDVPLVFSRTAWRLMQGLDALPWPWGEALMGALFVAKAPLKPARLRQAFRWVSAQPTIRERPGKLVAQLYFHHGLAVARAAAVGLRDPRALPLVVQGRELLDATSGGAILLGLHLGMPNSDVMLRVAGYRLRWLGGERPAGGWARIAWQPFIDRSEDLVVSRRLVDGGVLRRAARLLLDGQTVYMTADGNGREAFSLPLPGRPPLPIRSGWVVLRELAGVPVLPVLSHREGRRQVVTIHPPLPTDLDACATTLGHLLQDFAGRFPSQCYSLAFGQLSTKRARAQ